jgi:hypothetical protein
VLIIEWLARRNGSPRIVAAVGGARAGRAQSGARDERVHRRDDSAMRTTGAPVVRVGRPPRLDRGIVRRGDRTGEPRSSRRGARRAGPLPTGHLRIHRRRNRIDKLVVEAHFAGRRFVSPGFATDRGDGAVLHPARHSAGCGAEFRSIRRIPDGATPPSLALSFFTGPNSGGDREDSERPREWGPK